MTVLIALDYPVGTYTLASMLLVIPLLIGGWFLVRKRVYEIAAVREGFTGVMPIIATTPAVEAAKWHAEHDGKRQKPNGSHRHIPKSEREQ